MEVCCFTYFPLHMTTDSKLYFEPIVKNGCGVGVALRLVARMYFVAKRGKDGVFFVADSLQGKLGS